MPWYFFLVLLHTALILLAGLWMFSEFTGYDYKPFVVLVPLVVMMVAQWMQWTYGRIVVKESKSSIMQDKS